MFLDMNIYALVSIETREQDKAPVVMYITIGEMCTHQPSDEELFNEAIKYINNNSLSYKLLDIIYLTREQYDSILRGQIADYLCSE